MEYWIQISHPYQPAQALILEPRIILVIGRTIISKSILILYFVYFIREVVEAWDIACIYAELVKILCKQDSIEYTLKKSLAN